ncbi:hypothetical protein HJC23_008452 [Cyclotella cryptica]|uniref:Uncharacterized protein n=1 Tax=Cyclotella cryptica TaxID=29204 RepID=A0ABD3QX42_9STRA
MASDYETATPTPTVYHIGNDSNTPGRTPRSFSPTYSSNRASTSESQLVGSQRQLCYDDGTDKTVNAIRKVILDDKQSYRKEIEKIYNKEIRELEARRNELQRCCAETDVLIRRFLHDIGKERPDLRTRERQCDSES